MTENNPLMKCGHAANGVHKGHPVCVACFGIVDGADVVDTYEPQLQGRKAQCVYGGKEGHPGSEVDSSTRLAFFEHRPNEATDRYYCGCFGWN
jgi:hypothetical protein